jgi:hypothetical protein
MNLPLPLAVAGEPPFTFCVIEYSGFYCNTALLSTENFPRIVVEPNLSGKRYARSSLEERSPSREVAGTSEEWLRAVRLASDKMRSGSRSVKVSRAVAGLV